jgi:hypothetical protein
MKTGPSAADYGTWETLDDASSPAEARPNPRYCAEAEILQHALDGNMNAAQQVLQYLASSLPELRHIMQATLHDLVDPRLWHHLLAYIAWHTWGDWRQIGDWSLYHSPHLSAVHLDAPVDALEQTIVESFVVDESQAESEMKRAALIQGLDGPPNIRKAAAYLLGLRREPRALPVLVEIVGDHQEAGDALAWQLRAVEALAALGEPAGAPALARALASGRGVLHQAASKALRDLGGAAEPVLLELLGHPNSHVRWHAARALGQIGDPRGIDTLAHGLLDENQAVRWATASLLAHLDSLAIPAVLNILVRYPLNEPLRYAINHALHAMPSPTTQNYLRPLLDALNGPAASVEAPALAEHMLEEWRNS